MNILFLDLDTLRPDHLGCYGYSRDTSPNIDWIAQNGVRYDKYYCSDAPCLPSRAALMTGRFGLHTGVVGHGGTAADMRLGGALRDMTDRNGIYNMPSMLRRFGMHTALISPFAERHGAFWFYAGFNEMYNTGHCGIESGEEITPTVLKWLDDNKDKENWYLHVNYWDAHTPYRAPEEFGNPFAGKPPKELEWMTDEVLEQHLKAVGPHTASELNMYNEDVHEKYPRQLGRIHNREDLNAVIDGYDCGIRYMDEQVGKILEVLKQNNMLENTAIIVTADHGENMGELGIYSEHATADDITCRIPMIIKWPDGRKNVVDKAFHYNLDLLPTLKDLFVGQDVGRSHLIGNEVASGARLDGKSYSSSIISDEEDGHEYLVLSQCAHVCQRAVRFHNWIYIRTYHDGYHLFDDEMLFDLNQDPHEQHNLANSHREVCFEGSYLLEKWHAKQMQAMCDESQIDPMWTVIAEGGPFHAKGHLKNYCSRLMETGRNEGAEELKRRHPNEY